MRRDIGRVAGRAKGLWLALCLVAAGGAGGAGAAPVPLTLLTPADAARVAGQAAARMAAVAAAQAAGLDLMPLAGQPRGFDGVPLAGTYQCRAVYYLGPKLLVNDWRGCSIAEDGGPHIVVPGLFDGHLVAGTGVSRVFYGVRLAAGGGVAPRYGFSPSRDVAGFFLNLGGRRLRLEVAAGPGRYEVVEFKPAP